VEFFDWLLGTSRLGILKSALVSVFLGSVVLLLIYPFIYSAQGGRFLVILSGFIVLFVLRALYWRARSRQLWRWLEERNPRARSAILALSWRQPAMALEFQTVIDLYMQDHRRSQEAREDSPGTA
jgi:hypothetical protein